MGFSAARTYDLEVWLPGQGALSRDFELLDLHRFPGAPDERALSARGREGRRASSTRSTARGWRSGGRWSRCSRIISRRTARSRCPTALQPYLRRARTGWSRAASAIGSPSPGAWRVDARTVAACGRRVADRRCAAAVAAASPAATRLSARRRRRTPPPARRSAASPSATTSRSAPTRASPRSPPRAPPGKRARSPPTRATVADHDLCRRSPATRCAAIAERDRRGVGGDRARQRPGPALHDPRRPAAGDPRRPLSPRPRRARAGIAIARAYGVDMVADRRRQRAGRALHPARRPARADPRRRDRAAPAAPPSAPPRSSSTSTTS